MKGIASALFALALAGVAASGEARTLAIALDNSKEMRSIEAVDTAISYINTLMQGYAKGPEPVALSVNLYQFCAETPLFAETRFYCYPGACRVGDGRQFYAEKKSRAERESAIVHAATKRRARNDIFDWAGKSDGIILVSTTPDAKALNLGDGFHAVVIPARDAKDRLAKEKFTADLQKAIDDFLEDGEEAGVAVVSFTASPAKAFAGAPVAFAVESPSSPVLVVFGDGKQAEWREGRELKHVYEKPGRYRATARAGGKDPGKALEIQVNEPAAVKVAVRPEKLTTGVDAEVGFELQGAPSAAVDFGDGTEPDFVKVTAGRITVKHRYGKAGAYTLRVTPRDGERTFPAATAAVVVAAEPRSLGIALSANRAAATLPDGNIEFSAKLDNAVKAEMDFGDGTPKENASARMSHSYSREGTYEAKLTAWAADGGSASRTWQVTIAPAPVPAPACTFEPGAPKATLGEPLEVRCRFQNTERASARFPDGSETELDIGGDGTAAIRHEFPTAGTQAIVVKMTGNGKTVEARCQVAVDKPEESFGTLALYVSRDGEDVPLENDGAGHYRVKAGEEITLKAEKARNVSITVNYGDESDPERGATTSHVYQEGGEYTIEVNAKGTLTKAPLPKKTLTVTVKGSSPLPAILAVLAVLAAAFGIGKAVAQGNRKLAVTGPDGKETKRKPGRVTLDPGVEIQVAAAKGGVLSVALVKGSATAEGRALSEQPAKFGRRVEIRTVGGTWTVELL